MREVVCVLHHRDALLGYSGSAKALDDVALYAPRHRADEPVWRRWRERRTYSEQLRHERRVVGYPVAHNNLAARFRNPHHLLGDVVGLRREHRTEHRENQFEGIVVDSLQIAGIPLTKLQPIKPCLRYSLVAGLHKVPGDIDCGYIGAQKG